MASSHYLNIVIILSLPYVTIEPDFLRTNLEILPALASQNGGTRSKETLHLLNIHIKQNVVWCSTALRLPLFSKTLLIKLWACMYSHLLRAHNYGFSDHQRRV